MGVTNSSSTLLAFKNLTTNPIYTGMRKSVISDSQQQLEIFSSVSEDSPSYIVSRSFRVDEVNKQVGTFLENAK
jgi:beta-xylosidase